VFSIGGLDKGFCQSTLSTVNKLGEITSVQNFDADENNKLINQFEKYDYKEGIDTLSTVYKEVEHKVVRHISNYYKVKTELFDKNWNPVQTMYFDTLRLTLHLGVYRNGRGLVIKTYENIGDISTTIRYFDSGIMSSFNVFNEKDNHLEMDILFDSTGATALRTHYVHDNNTLRTISYWENSTQPAVEYFEGNKPTPYHEFYPDGNIRMKGKILGVSIHFVGTCELYFHNGNLEREFHFDNSIPNYKSGIWKWWDESGNLLKEEFYENNELVDVKEYDPGLNSKGENNQ